MSVTEVAILAINAQLKHAFGAKDKEIERLCTALKAARAFINEDTPDWRTAKQAILREIDDILE